MSFDPVECAKCGRGKHVKQGEFADGPLWEWECCKGKQAFDCRPQDADAPTDDELDAAKADPRQIGLPL